MERCHTSKNDSNLYRFMYDLSKELDKEIGIAYCRRRDNSLYPYRLCIGDSCTNKSPGVDIEPCPGGQKRMDVHTHPRLPVPLQSTGDIMESSRYGMHQSCIIDSDGRYACISGFDKTGLKVRSELYQLRHECGQAEYDDALRHYREGHITYEMLKRTTEPYYSCVMRNIPRSTKLKVCEGQL